MSRKDLDDPDLCVADLMRRWPGTITVFLRHGMMCVGCPVGHLHTVADACLAHDLDCALFMAALRDEILTG